MKITSKTTLADIQTHFHKSFPHLRIEFYESRHDAGEGSSNQEKIDTERRVIKISEKALEQELAIDKDLRIKEFESHMSRDLGLNVQVFRRSGNLWLQTTVTDGWTLDEANRKGGHSEELYDDLKTS